MREGLQDRTSAYQAIAKDSQGRQPFGRQSPLELTCVVVSRAVVSLDATCDPIHVAGINMIRTTVEPKAIGFSRVPICRQGGTSCSLGSRTLTSLKGNSTRIRYLRKSPDAQPRFELRGTRPRS